MQKYISRFFISIITTFELWKDGWIPQCESPFLAVESNPRWILREIMQLLKVMYFNETQSINDLHFPHPFGFRTMTEQIHNLNQNKWIRRVNYICLFVTNEQHLPKVAWSTSYTTAKMNQNETKRWDFSFQYTDSQTRPIWQAKFNL